MFGSLWSFCILLQLFRVSLWLFYVFLVTFYPVVLHKRSSPPSISINVNTTHISINIYKPSLDFNSESSLHICPVSSECSYMLPPLSSSSSPVSSAYRLY